MTDTTTKPASSPESGTSPSNSAPPRSRARFITPILGGVALLAVGVFGGVFIGQATATSTAAGPGGFSANGAAAPGGANRGGGNFTSGTVATNSDGTLTITTDDGETVTVTTGDDTSVTTTTDAAVSDLAEGDTVTVVGETDDDGNVTATTITEGAAIFGGGGFPGGGAPTDAPSDD